MPDRGEQSLCVPNSADERQTAIGERPPASPLSLYLVFAKRGCDLGSNAFETSTGDLIDRVVKAYIFHGGASQQSAVSPGHKISAAAIDNMPDADIERLITDHLSAH